MRETIDLAQKNEADTQSLYLFAVDRLPELHPAIHLPDEAKPESLAHFLNRYIEHVPDFLDALIDIASTAGVYAFIERIVAIAQSYFRKQNEHPAEQHDLLSLVDSAYLAHRLMEEINDRILMLSGIPLIPMDLSLSNLIVHSLLGEEFANKLDLAVLYSMEALFEDFSQFENPAFQAYVALHKAEGWTEELDNWPCLACDTSIALSFARKTNEVNLH